jgi:2'-hydroxyisoflavone reductase
MNILILGGTGYIGPHLVRLAVSRGHKVTTFTRGRRKPGLPPGVIQLIGDRNGQLQALEGKTWDAVIDDSATNPEWVRLSTELLKGRVVWWIQRTGPRVTACRGGSGKPGDASDRFPYWPQRLRRAA